MIIERKWAKDIEVDDQWDMPCKLAKHRIYIYWSHPQLLICDEMGIRIPTGFSSFKDKYKRSKGRRKVFCFGGSTTLGSFCSYEETYPHYLENVLKDAVVFNFGLAGCDLRGAMYLLLDLLRWEYIPDLITFLDGINEKQAWFQSLEGFKDYEETSCHYGYFKTLIEQHRYPMIYGRKSERNLVGKVKKILHKIGKPKKDSKVVQNPFRFVNGQAEYYSKINKIIKKLAATWNIKTKFFLQPILWDVWKEAPDQRHTYLKMLYGNIINKCPEVRDLSEKVPLEPSEFIDWQHLLPSGNKVLAEVIAREVK